MKKTVNHILVAGLLALLSLASCTDEFIEIGRASCRERV